MVLISSDNCSLGEEKKNREKHDERHLGNDEAGDGDSDRIGNIPRLCHVPKVGFFCFLVDLVQQAALSLPNLLHHHLPRGHHLPHDIT